MLGVRALGRSGAWLSLYLDTHPDAATSRIFPGAGGLPTPGKRVAPAQPKTSYFTILMSQLSEVLDRRGRPVRERAVRGAAGEAANDGLVWIGRQQVRGARLGQRTMDGA
jgi:hypothetical protein